MDGCIGVFEVVKFHTKRHRAIISRSIASHTPFIISIAGAYGLFVANFDAIAFFHFEDCTTFFPKFGRWIIFSNFAILKMS